MHKKVLLLITKSNWGGAQRYVFDLATNLPDGYEPVVALGGDGVLIEKLEAAGVRVIRIPGLQRDISLRKEMLSLWHLIKIIRAERPDILHLNSSKAGFIGALLGRLCRVPRVIFTAHGWAFNEDRGPLARYAFGVFHWLTILFAHRTITVSRALKAQMRWWFTQRKMVIVPLGRSNIAFRDKGDARGILEMRVSGKAVGLTAFHDDTWIGTIAELHPVKRLDVAISAIAVLIHAFPRLRYVIIGEGEQRTTLEKHIEALGLEEHVFLLGAVDEAARFLKAFDTFLLTSRSEAAGYVVLEAGQAEVPVVATAVGGIPDFVTNNESGLLVPSNNPEATAFALAELLRHPRRAQEYAETLKTLADTYTIDRMTQETLAVYAHAKH